MNFFKSKCAYCGTKIEKGKEITRDVRTPGFIGTKRKLFISEEHADMYEREAEEHMKKQKSGGGCCS